MKPMDLYATPPANPAAAAAARALAIPRRMLQRSVRDLDTALDSIWTAKEPAAALAALGTNGAALFEALAAWKAFLEAQRPGSTATPSFARSKPVTANPDGTATLK